MLHVASASITPDTQGQGACKYELCATAQWADGLLKYQVVVEHEASLEEHTVQIQVTGEVTLTAARVNARLLFMGVLLLLLLLLSSH